VVDANRDGIADPASADDQEHGDEWTALWGASFLANLDDDDSDGVRDADDAIVNVTAGNDADALDLARIVVVPWPEVPEGAQGTLSIDAASAGYVRVFQHGPDDSWTAVLGVVGTCSEDAGASCEQTLAFVVGATEIAQGLELGIEGLELVGLDAAGGWDGMVELDWAVVDAAAEPVLSAEHPEDGVDRVKLREAPWIMLGNLDRYELVYASLISDGFVADLSAALLEAGLSLAGIPWEGADGWQDQWIQDVFQNGYIAIPAQGGTVHGMRVALARPYSYAGAPIDWLLKNHLGPDASAVAVYRLPQVGTTYDSYGNHELIPPYQHGASSFPLGRIVYGTGSGVLPETKAFYEAQQVQAPALDLDTSWLAVGHIDEVLSFVPANTEQGWKLLVASPEACTALLAGWQAQGLGSTQMFVGKQLYNGIDAAVSIDALLTDPDMASWNQYAQSRIDEMLDTLTVEVGLGPTDVIALPVYFHDDGGMLAYTASSINALVANGTFVAANPFGPSINGQDGFKTDLQQRLGVAASGLGLDGQGLKVRFANDWDWYHVLMGEVHCATNPDGPPASHPWWEVAR